MSEGEDLLGKADALLSKYRPAPAEHEIALQDFPVLTEVVETPIETPASDSEPNSVESSRHSPKPTLDQELRQLEYELRQRVLSAIEPYVASFLGKPLEMRIRTHLGPALDRLAAEIAGVTREEIAELMRKAVAGAVEREIAELQARIKG